MPNSEPYYKYLCNQALQMITRGEINEALDILFDLGVKRDLTLLRRSTVNLLIGLQTSPRVPDPEVFLKESWNLAQELRAVHPRLEVVDNIELLVLRRLHRHRTGTAGSSGAANDQPAVDVPTAAEEPTPENPTGGAHGVIDLTTDDASRRDFDTVEIDRTRAGSSRSGGDASRGTGDKGSSRQALPSAVSIARRTIEVMSYGDNRMGERRDLESEYEKFALAASK